MKEYIEREALLDAISDWLMKAAHPENMSSYNDGERAAYRTAMSEIANLPAADVRPVVRGKWKVSLHKTYYDVSCSVCGINSFFQVDEKDSVSYANYCPNCGADMRAEEGDT